MTQIVTYLLFGVGSGGLVAGLGLGVVLSYRGAGVINLAAGAVAMVAGYFFWSIRLGRFAHLATAPAVILTLVFAALVGVVFESVVVRPLRTGAPLAKLLATLGALVGLQSLVVLVFGGLPKLQPSILPTGNIRVWGVLIGEYNFYIVGVVAVLTVGLIVLYRWTRFGIATRAAAENQVHAMVAGLSPGSLSLVNTVLMSVLMAAVGLLAASTIGLDASTLPLLVVPGLTAAMFGRFTSFGVTFAVGLLIGVAQSLLVYLSTQSWFPNTGNGPGFPLPGVQQLLTFVLLAAAIYFREAKIPGRGDIVDRRLPMVPRPRSPLRTAVIYVTGAAIALLFLPSTWRTVMDMSLVISIGLLSIVVITGYLGQVSLLQLAIGGVAAFSGAHFARDYGLGSIGAPLLGVLAGAVLGVLCAIPAVRVRGVSLAVLSLAAAVAIEDFGFNNHAFGGLGFGLRLPDPHLFGIDVGPDSTAVHGFNGTDPSPLFCWFALLVLAAIGLVVCNLRRSGLGLNMLAVRANERAASAVGINVRSTKLVGIAISSLIAAIGGVMLAYQYDTITASSFDILIALDLVAFAYIWGITSVVGAIWGGITFVGGITAYALWLWFGLQGTWFTVGSGLLLILTLIGQPTGIATTICYGDWRARAVSRPRRGRHDSLRSSPTYPFEPAGPSAYPNPNLAGPNSHSAVGQLRIGQDLD